MATACCLKLKKIRQNKEAAASLCSSIDLESLDHEVYPNFATDCQLIAAATACSLLSLYYRQWVLDT